MIICTGSISSAGRVADAARRLSLDAAVVHTLRFDPPADPGPLREALRRPRYFDWVAFSSEACVDAVALEIRASGIAALPWKSAAVVGETTARAAEAAGFPVSLVGPGDGVGLARAMVSAGVGRSGERVLLPRSDIGRDVLADGLEAAGAEVVRVVAYTTVEAAEISGALRDALSRGEVAAVAFTSPSSVRAFLTALGAVPPGVAAASIGSTTSAALRSAGWEPAAEASPHTAKGLASALAALVRAL